MTKISKKQLNYWIGTLGYEILDEIVAPECGISDVIADLYGVDIDVYTCDEKLTLKIARKIVKRYKLGDLDKDLNEVIIGEIARYPIALIALYILENGEYQ